MAAVMISQLDNSKLITAAQMMDSDITIVRNWFIAGKFPARTHDFAPASHDLKSYWVGRKSLFLDDRNILWRNRSDTSSRAQLVVPRSLRDTIFNDSHHTTYGGHFGITHTHTKIQLHYFWPGMSDFVRDRISACHKCVARKSPVNRHHPMGHVPVSGKFERVAMDLLDVSVISAKGYKYILVVCDYFTKYTEAYPLKDKTARSVADALMDVWLPRYGFPLFLHSDQGKEFDNAMIHKLSELLGTVKTKTTPYHPRSDGLVERFNRTLLAMLAMFVSQEHDNWDDLLPFMMLAYNTTVHTSTGYTPYRLVFGDECNLIHRELRADPPPGDPGTYAVWVQQALYESYEEVRAQQQRATHRQKRNYDSKAVARAFPIGCWTLRYYPPARRNKLCSPWIGPYKVVRAPMEWVVGIQLDAGAHIIYVHMDDLKRCAPPDPEPTWPDAARGTSVVVSTRAPSTLARSDVSRSQHTSVNISHHPIVSAHPKSVSSGPPHMRAPTLPGLRSGAHQPKSTISGQIDVRAPISETSIVKTDTDNNSIAEKSQIRLMTASPITLRACIPAPDQVTPQQAFFKDLDFYKQTLFHTPFLSRGRAVTLLEYRDAKIVFEVDDWFNLLPQGVQRYLLPLQSRYAKWYSENVRDLTQNYSYCSLCKTKQANLQRHHMQHHARWRTIWFCPIPGCPSSSPSKEGLVKHLVSAPHARGVNITLARKVAKQIANQNSYWPVTQVMADKLLSASKRLIRYIALYSMAGVAMENKLFRIHPNARDTPFMEACAAFLTPKMSLSQVMPSGCHFRRVAQPSPDLLALTDRPSASDYQEEVLSITPDDMSEAVTTPVFQPYSGETGRAWMAKEYGVTMDTSSFMSSEYERDATDDEILSFDLGPEPIEPGHTTRLPSDEWLDDHQQGLHPGSSEPRYDPYTKYLAMPNPPSIMDLMRNDMDMGARDKSPPPRAHTSPQTVRWDFDFVRDEPPPPPPPPPVTPPRAQDKTPEPAMGMVPDIPSPVTKHGRSRGRGSWRAPPKPNPAPGVGTRSMTRLAERQDREDEEALAASARWPPKPDLSTDIRQLTRELQIHDEPRFIHAEMESALPSGEEGTSETVGQPPAVGLISRQQDTYFIPPPSRAVGGARGRSVPVSTATLGLIHRQDPALAALLASCLPYDATNQT